MYDVIPARARKRRWVNNRRCGRAWPGTQWGGGCQTPVVASLAPLPLLAFPEAAQRLSGIAWPWGRMRRSPRTSSDAIPARARNGPPQERSASRPRLAGNAVGRWMPDSCRGVAGASPSTCVPGSRAAAIRDRLAMGKDAPIASYFFRRDPGSRAERPTAGAIGVATALGRERSGEVDARRLSWRCWHLPFNLHSRKPRSGYPGSLRLSSGVRAADVAAPHPVPLPASGERERAPGGRLPHSPSLPHRASSMSSIAPAFWRCWRWVEAAVSASRLRMAATTAAWSRLESTGFGRSLSVCMRARCA